MFLTSVYLAVTFASLCPCLSLIVQHLVAERLCATPCDTLLPCSYRSSLPQSLLALCLSLSWLSASVSPGSLPQSPLALRLSLSWLSASVSPGSLPQSPLALCLSLSWLSASVSPGSLPQSPLALRLSLPWLSASVSPGSLPQSLLALCLSLPWLSASVSPGSLPQSLLALCLSLPWLSASVSPGSLPQSLLALLGGRRKLCCAERHSALDAPGCNQQEAAAPIMRSVLCAHPFCCCCPKPIQQHTISLQTTNPTALTTRCCLLFAVVLPFVLRTPLLPFAIGTPQHGCSP